MCACGKVLLGKTIKIEFYMLEQFGWTDLAARTHRGDITTL